MLSKNKIKYIHSLELKKKRKEENAFVAEGPKLIDELLGHFPCKLLLASPEWLHNHPFVTAEEILEVTPEEMLKTSFLKTPQEVLAIFEKPEENKEITEKMIIKTQHSLSLALDGIQDPGNLGTIIRLADWFGIERIFCSLNTVDVYNPKTVQATMGGLARVKLYYIPLNDFLLQLKDFPIYGTFLDGPSLYSEALTPNGLIVMGNEGNGISPEIEQLINRRLYIPNYPPQRQTSESLNVAIATAIICSEFRRKNL